MSTAKLVGINHVALEVGDLDAALDFYGRLFDFQLRGRSEEMAFLDMGDQFVALSEGRSQAEDASRHVGLVVDDLETARDTIENEGAEILPGRGLDFLDPWGNRIQLVDYREVQLLKDPRVLQRLGLEDIGKFPEAIGELRGKGYGAD